MTWQRYGGVRWSRGGEPRCFLRWCLVLEEEGYGQNLVQAKEGGLVGSGVIRWRSRVGDGGRWCRVGPLTRVHVHSFDRKRKKKRGCGTV